MVNDFAFLGFLGEVNGRRFSAAKDALPWKTEMPLGFFSVTGWLMLPSLGLLLLLIPLLLLGGDEAVVGVDAERGCEPPPCLASIMAFCCCFSLRVLRTWSMTSGCALDCPAVAVASPPPLGEEEEGELLW
jgi:hypothetical protein